MEIPILVHPETVPETSAGHLKDCVLDGGEFVLNLFILAIAVVECTEHVECFVLAALEDQPAWAFWYPVEAEQESERPHALEDDRHAPGQDTA